MPYCPECGAEVSEGASFCDSCGAELNVGTTDAEEDVPGPITEESSAGEVSAEGFDWRHAGGALGFALLPAFGAYMLVSLAAYEVMPVVLLLAIPIFGYLIYRKETRNDMASGMFFWLAVEAFLSPLAAIVYTSSYSAAETTTAAEQAGAAIGGGIVTVLAFVVGLPVGIVLYLISRRLETE